MSWLNSPMEDSSKRMTIMRITCLAFLLTLTLSWRAYIHELRIFSLAPVVKVLEQTPALVEWSLLVLQIVLLAWLLLRPLKHLPAAGVLFITAFWVLQDLMRFQPYIYMYFFTILFAVFFKENGLNALKIMVGSVYFWAGFQKLNLTFFTSTFPWFIAPLYKFSSKPSVIDLFVFCIALSVPVFEASIGWLLLFFPKKWKLASFMACIMTLVVLACLGPFGHNLNIIAWPWNTYLLLIEWILFYKPSSSPQKKLFQYSIPTFTSLVLFSIAPAFALFGLWHSFPAFAIYSGNIKYAEVIFSKDEIPAHLPDNLGQFISYENSLSLSRWTNNEFNIIPYPENDVFKAGAMGLCSYLMDKRGAILRIHIASPFYSATPSQRDFPLCPDDDRMCEIPHKDGK